MTDKNDDDPMGKALGLPALKFEKTIDNLIAQAHDDSAKNDFEAARANLYEVIQTGKEAMDKLTEIAGQSQHPRAFEVLAKLMDTIVTTNKELLQLQTKIREIDAADAPTNEKAKNITNNLFVGSTAELQKMIKDMNTRDE
jgi:predicted transcriptional regulator